MDKVEILKVLHEMLEKAKEDTEKPYRDEYEQGHDNGRVDALEDVIDLIQKS